MYRVQNACHPCGSWWLQRGEVPGPNGLVTVYGVAAWRLRRAVAAGPMSHLLISDRLRSARLAEDLQQTLTWSKPSLLTTDTGHRYKSCYQYATWRIRGAGKCQLPPTCCTISVITSERNVEQWQLQALSLLRSQLPGAVALHVELWVPWSLHKSLPHHSNILLTFLYDLLLWEQKELTKLSVLSTLTHRWTLTCHVRFSRQTAIVCLHTLNLTDTVFALAIYRTVKCYSYEFFVWTG